MKKNFKVWETDKHGNITTQLGGHWTIPVNNLEPDTSTQHLALTKEQLKERLDAEKARKAERKEVKERTAGFAKSCPPLIASDAEQHTATYEIRDRGVPC